MIMEDVLDGVRRIIHKWVNTSELITSDVSVGDTVINVTRSIRFQGGDEVMLQKGNRYETDLFVDCTNHDDKTVTLTTSVLNNFTVAEGSLLIKAIGEQFVQGIYIGEPDVIPRYPAITVNGVSRSSEWLTLESTKERFEIEIGVYVLASTQEQGYRFLMNVTDIIQRGLKRNIIPLANNFDVTTLVENIEKGDITINLTDRELVRYFRRIYIEDNTNSQENWVTFIFDEVEDPSSSFVKLQACSAYDFDKDETTVIIPKRFIYNSWPATIQYGEIHKGELLKAAKISWFAEEEELQGPRRSELKLN